VLDSDDELLASVDLADGDGGAEWIAEQSVDAVGHRVVHGGERTEATLLDDDEIARLRALTDLAPLHQPRSLAGIELTRKALPNTPAVACFDTAFHATLPASASTYPLPLAWREQWQVKRYGFHGLSHAYAARRARELGAGPRMVTCHLGAGASLAAVRDGRSIDTTMGFTPNDGLVMATRSGAIDPGLVLWLIEHAGIPASELADTLEKNSGLLALGGTADMRTLLERTDDEATLALAVYLHRLRGGIGAMTAALGGVDALVFTGGVGENAPLIREEACAGLAYLGIDINANVFVVEAREDIEIARQTRAVLTRS
jgi:acetate kinase